MHTSIPVRDSLIIWILGEMAKVPGEPRDDLSEHAPRFITIKINPEKITAVIRWLRSSY